MNGEIKLKRTILQQKEKGDVEVIDEKRSREIIVLDEYLQVKQMPHKVTKGLTEEISWWAQHEGSYTGAQEIMRAKEGINVSDEYIRTIAMEVGELVYQDDTRKSEDIEHLNEESRKAPVNDKDLKVQADGGKHYIKEKDFAVSSGNVEEFSKYIYECAVSNGYERYKNTVIVSDGAAWIKNMCEDIFPKATQILDFYHLAEHVYDAGKELFADDAKKYTPWAEHIISLLRRSEVSSVFEVLSKYKEGSKCIEKLSTYIENNRERIDYARYKREGYYIGSGPIESANKTVVQRRCKQSGMRWNIQTAQLMLSLRAKVESGKWANLIPRLLHAA
jgi:hypothetical protein